MIIELCGIPGAGKTFLARQLAAEVRRRGGSATLVLEPVGPARPKRERMLRRSLRAGAELLLHPGRALGAVAAIAASDQVSARDVAARSVNWLVLQHGLRRARRLGGIHLVDQGLVQELCSIAHRGDASGVLSHADPGPDRLGPDHLLVVGVDPVLADHRLGQRVGRQSRIERDGCERLDGLAHFVRIVDQQLAAWLDRFSDRVPTRVQPVTSRADGFQPSVQTLADSLGLGGDGGEPGSTPPPPGRPAAAPRSSKAEG